MRYCFQKSFVSTGCSWNMPVALDRRLIVIKLTSNIHQETSPTIQTVPERYFSKLGNAHFFIHSEFNTPCIVARSSGWKDNIDRIISRNAAFSSSPTRQIQLPRVPAMYSEYVSQSGLPMTQKTAYDLDLCTHPFHWNTHVLPPTFPTTPGAFSPRRWPVLPWYHPHWQKKARIGGYQWKSPIWYTQATKCHGRRKWVVLQVQSALRVVEWLWHSLDYIDSLLKVKMTLRSRWAGVGLLRECTPGTFSQATSDWWFHGERWASVAFCQDGWWGMDWVVHIFHRSALLIAGQSWLEDVGGYYSCGCLWYISALSNSYYSSHD